MPKRDVVARTQELASKVAPQQALEIDEGDGDRSEGPVPLVEPNGHIDIVFRLTTLSGDKDEGLVYQHTLDARGQPVPLGHWFADPDDSDLQTLRLPWRPGPPLSNPAENRTGKHHRNGQPTEKIAAQLGRPNSGTQRAAVLGAFMTNYRSGGDGFIDEELAAHLNLNLYSAAPRRTELVDGGWLRASGRLRPTALHRPSTVWELTTQAIETAGLRRKDPS